MLLLKSFLKAIVITFVAMIVLFFINISLTFFLGAVIGGWIRFVSNILFIVGFITFALHSRSIARV